MMPCLVIAWDSRYLLATAFMLAHPYGYPQAVGSGHRARCSMVLHLCWTLGPSNPGLYRAVFFFGVSFCLHMRYAAIMIGRYWNRVCHTLPPAPQQVMSSFHFTEFDQGGIQWIQGWHMGPLWTIQELCIGLVGSAWSDLSSTLSIAIHLYAMDMVMWNTCL